MEMKAKDLQNAMALFASETPECTVDPWARIQVHTGQNRITGESMKTLAALGWDESYHGEDDEGGWMYEIGA